MILSNTPDCLRDLVGIPYAFRGRTGEGLDCWQLVQRAALELFGLVYPDFPNVLTMADATPTMRAARGGWWQVDDAAAGDVVMFTMGGEPLHVGIVLTPPRFLHTLKGRESCIESYDSISWRSRRAGFYRWPT